MHPYQSLLQTNWYFLYFTFLDSAVMIILLFHQDPPIRTNLCPDVDLEPCITCPCTATLSRRSYNTSPGSGRFLCMVAKMLRTKTTMGVRLC